VLPDEKGKPYTVRYEVVNAMLLNEFLKHVASLMRSKSKLMRLLQACRRWPRRLANEVNGLSDMAGEATNNSTRTRETRFHGHFYV
jgi:hypothetical protein